MKLVFFYEKNVKKVVALQPFGKVLVYSQHGLLKTHGYEEGCPSTGSGTGVRSEGFYHPIVLAVNEFL